MLRDAAVDLLMKRLGNRTDTALRDVIISEMDYVQTFVLEKTYPLPWFLVTRDATLVTAVSTETVALPSDFLAEWDYGGLARIDADGDEIKMRRQDYDWMRKNKQGEGTPDYYDIAGTNFRIRLIPDSAISLVFWYFGQDASIAGEYGDSANIENNWLKYAADLVMAETGKIMAGFHLQSPAMAQNFQMLAAEARCRLDVQITAMEESSKQQFMEG